MKNLTKITSFIASSLVALSLVISPSISFAESNLGASVKVKNNSRSTVINKLFSWFSNRAYAADINLTPNISGITAPTMLKVGETGTWIINASDPKNGSLTYSVDWDDDSAKTSSLAREFVQTGTFTHMYMKAGNYKVKFTVSNTTGQYTVSTVTVHVNGSKIVTAPVISNLIVNAIKPKKAEITWSTDVRASSMIWYSTTSPVNTSGKANLSRPGKELNHKVNLNKLKEGTKYYVVVGSANRNSTTLSAETSFVTPVKQKEDAPVITSLSGANTVVAGNTETVTVNAYDPSNGPLSYSVDWGDISVLRSFSAQGLVFVQSAKFEHIYSVAGTYQAKFTVENSKGKKATSSMTITVTPSSTDTTKPVISNVQIQSTNSGSTIIWNTDESTTSKIFYSKDTPVNVNLDATARVIDTTLSATHSLNIPSLTSSTLYHFIIGATDASGNMTLSNEGTFVTSF